jgi:hypothetical protein
MYLEHIGRTDGKWPAFGFRQVIAAVHEARAKDAVFDAK